MEPALHGNSLAAACRNCNREFHVAVETYVGLLPMRCSQCGGQCDVNSDQIFPGEVVRVAIGTDTVDFPRFSLVAFHSSREQAAADTPPQVKRVWGLPGERLSIRGGEMWIDGQLLQKSLPELRQLAVPVYEFPKHGPGGWSRGTQQLDASFPQLELGPSYTLRWSYRRPAPVVVADVPEEQWMVESPLTDDLDCNQGVSYLLRQTDEFLLDVGFQTRIRLPLTIHFSQFAGSRTITALPTGWSGERPENSHWIECGRSLTIAACDRRLWLDSDQAAQAKSIPLPTELAFVEDRPQQTPLNSDRNFWIEFESDARVVIEQLKLARDICLRPLPDNRRDTQQFDAVPVDSYFVLGDNQPVSIDSRGTLGVLPQPQIIGIATRARENPAP